MTGALGLLKHPRISVEWEIYCAPARAAYTDKQSNGLHRVGRNQAGHDPGRRLCFPPV
jgi:hypothetical protein